MSMVQPSYKRYKDIANEVNNLLSNRTIDNIDKTTDFIQGWGTANHKTIEIKAVKNSDVLNGSAGNIELKEKGKVAIITYSNNEKDYPQFTLLHEFGHLILHLQTIEENLMVDRKAGSEKKLVEREADIFASTILSPISAIVSFITEQLHENNEVKLRDVFNHFPLVPSSVIAKTFDEEKEKISKELNLQMKQGSEFIGT